MILCFCGVKCKAQSPKAPKVALGILNNIEITPINPLCVASLGAN